MRGASPPPPPGRSIEAYVSVTRIQKRNSHRWNSQTAEFCKCGQAQIEGILKILKDLKDAKNFRRLGKEIHGRQQHFVEEEDLRSQGCPRTGRLVPGKILISAPLNGLTGYIRVIGSKSRGVRGASPPPPPKEISLL